MTTLFSAPASLFAVALLVLAAMLLAVRSARLTARAIRHARAIDLVCGIRALILSLVSALFALGLGSGRSGFLAIGAIILAEELYETGVLFAVLRCSERSA